MPRLSFIFAGIISALALNVQHNALAQTTQPSVGIGDATYQDGKKSASEAVDKARDLTKDTSNTFAKENLAYDEENPSPLTRGDAGETGALEQLGQRQQVFKDHKASLATQPKFDPQQMQDLIKNSYTVSKSPQDYLGGVAADGTPIACKPVPTTEATPTTYEAVCEYGAAVTTASQTCSIPLQHNFSTTNKYSCSNIHEYGTRCLQWGTNGCTEPDPIDEMHSSGCYELARSPSCTQTAKSDILIREGQSNRGLVQVFYESYEYSCSSPINGTVTNPDYSLGGYKATFEAKGSAFSYLDSTRDETSCSSVAADTSCQSPVETCVDSVPSTRTINGVSITQSCWEWERSYSCQKVSTGHTSCQDLEANTLCRYDRSECLDDPVVDGSCQVENRVYVCSDAGTVSSEPTYVCADSIYCVNGQCDKVEAQPSQDFTKAVAALNSVAEAGEYLDPDNLKLFTGDDAGCHKPIFGLTNCCNGGKGVPLIGKCSAEERALAEAVDKGVTHYIGSYCSSKFIVCNSKTQVYCVFQSKLGRIIQEQGRAQLGLTWGKPKQPVCDGLTPEQFASLDLSKFNFSEVINDLTDKITIPDESGQLSDMQAKIKAYFSSRGQ